jgi:TRAP-type C4-dicarboxylate transport system permease small subunit
LTGDRAIKAAARLSARFGGAAILVSALLVGLEVISRNLGLGLRVHAFELTNYAFASAVAFGLAYAATSRAHIRIDIAYQWLSLTARALLDLLSSLLLFLLAGGMAWHAWRVVAQSLKLGARPNSTLDIPLAAPQALWALGLSWFALVTLALALQTLALLYRGRLDLIHARAGTGQDDTRESTR